MVRLIKSCPGPAALQGILARNRGLAGIDFCAPSRRRAPKYFYNKIGTERPFAALQRSVHSLEYFRRRRRARRTRTSDPGCVKTCADQKSLESNSNTPPITQRLDT